MNAIEVKGFSWQYHPNRPKVLKNVSIDIGMGEFLGVMGHTGAGKSTFALALRGLIPSFYEEGILGGSIKVLDIDVTKSDPQLFADKVGNVFQDASSQVLGTTVFADVAFGPSNLGLNKETVVHRTDQYIHHVRLDDKKWRSPSTLSGGELQRLVVAGVLSMETNVLVMDEPAAELDPRGKEDLCDLLDTIRKEKNFTVILIEQDPELIARYCDNVAVFKDGEIKLYGPPREVFKDPALCINVGINPPEISIILDILKKKFNVTLKANKFTSTEVLSQIELGSLSKNTKNTTKGKTKPPKIDALREKDVLFRIENLSHVYKTASGNVSAIEDINTVIYEGEYITIIGSNGAGKTTFTKHFNAILRPTVGKVFFKGEDITKKDTVGLVSEIGYCFQNPDHQIFSKTVFDEIAFGPRNLGVGEDIIKSKVEEVLEMVRLRGVAGENPFNLGKGERQKIALASTIVMEPKVMVIDEPTTGLDWLESYSMLELINKLHQNGTTIIAVTHDMRIVREYATRVIVMNDGKIVFDGATRDLVNQPNLFKDANIDITPSLKIFHAIQDYYPSNNYSSAMKLEDIAEVFGSIVSKIDIGR